MKKFSPQDLYAEKDVLYIDVRTPKEYQEDTVPGAINLPLFTHEQREEIGTIYKQVSKRDAIGLGYKYGGAKLQDYFKFVQENEDKYRKFIFMCQRGGGRSGFVTTNISLAFGNIYQLDGGYKGYRNYILGNLEDEVNKHQYLVLSGKTGIGKTRILTELENEGYPVIDLEGYANNRGSLFGDIGLVANSRKKFDSLLFKKLKDYSHSTTIIIEGESKRIGNIYLPSAITNKMETGIHLCVETPMGLRVTNILDDYGLNNGIISSKEKKIITNKISNLNKRLGNEAVNKLMDQIENNQYQEVVEFLINNYYDPLYQFSEDKYKKKIDASYETMDEGVQLVKGWFEKLNA